MCFLCGACGGHVEIGIYNVHACIHLHTDISRLLEAYAYGHTSASFFRGSRSKVEPFSAIFVTRRFRWPEAWTVDFLSKTRRNTTETAASHGTLTSSLSNQPYSRSIRPEASTRSLRTWYQTGASTRTQNSNPASHIPRPEFYVLRLFEAQTATLRRVL